jgi:hypothetical protein
MIEQYLAIRRQEYEYAVKHNLKTLQKVILANVKQVVKDFKYETKLNVQLELF